MVRDGVRLVVEDHGGPGDPVLLLHGLAGHRGEWDATVAWMRDAYRVVTLDQRGHGASERHPEDVSRAAYVADVVAVIEELGLTGAVVVGQSLGGHTALLTADARPDLVRALVMIEASPAAGDPEAPARIERRLASWPVPFASPAAAADFFGGGPAGAGWAAGLEERGDGWWPRFEPGLMVRSVETEDGGRDSWPEWERAACPALVVRAGQGFVTEAEVREMVRRRPETTVVEVPGAGHDVHLEDPRAVRAAIAGFLRTPPR